MSSAIIRWSFVALIAIIITYLPMTPAQPPALDTPAQKECRIKFHRLAQNSFVVISFAATLAHARNVLPIASSCKAHYTDRAIVRAAYKNLHLLLSAETRLSVAEKQSIQRTVIDPLAKLLK